MSDRNPHIDEVAEHLVAGILMRQPDLVSLVSEAGIDHAHFIDPRLMRVIVPRALAGEGTSFLDIIHLLPEDVRPLASQCETDAAPLVSNIGEYLQRLKTAWQGRELRRMAQEIESGQLAPDNFTSVSERFRVIESGLPSDGTRLPAIVDASRLIETETTLPPEIVQDVLHAGAKLVLGGGSKSFKTWSLLDLGLSVATGAEWWGFSTMRTPVLFVNFEIGAAFFAARIREVCEAKGIVLRAGQLDALNLRGYAADADTLLPAIASRMARGRYGLAIIDPLYKLLGDRDENASRDMAGLMNSIERLAVKTGAAVAFGSHFAKGNAAGKESMDRISGSGVFARDPDSILTMTKHEEEDAFTVELTLRNHPPQEAFVVRRRHPLMIRDSSLDPAKLKQAGGRRQETSGDDVLKLLGDEPMTYTEWAQRAKDELLISLPTFKRRVRELRDAGRVRQSPMEGGKYVRAQLGSNGVRTHLSLGSGSGVITPLGYDPDPNALPQGRRAHK